ncbi:inhibitor of nuclear factor kappa-B kinase subunit alpha isoform X2 [Fopius arisanus]|uniref:IkappaB kinase n=1 Tax=Fopius arisanus TaxID=64838 RepID=A0A9R1TDT1_9HYME|nr:PREDICTED: inhibitor of nuclear factor kappa-B kinase subunit alpha-like isoform X2 [Fopius arisanus]
MWKMETPGVLNRPENFWGLSEKEVLKIMRDISSAVEYLHANGITHRDLKPQNIVIQDGRSGSTYKLIDLGYAKELGEASAAASIVGTLNYVAPELFWKSSYSSSVDYWSLGILFYEILTGTRPFLPNMALNKNWMKHIRNKRPEDISAREINGKVEFSSSIDDPSNIPQCLRDALTPWFRLVLQWEPSTRGKIMENGKSVNGVFRLLKTIFTKKIVHLFFVSRYKTDNLLVEDTTKILDIGKWISEREKIQVQDQLLVSPGGKLLDCPDGRIVNFLEDGDEVIVFEKDNLLVKVLPDVIPPKDVQRMIEGGLTKKYDYQTLRKLYGATVFFMKQEVELYKKYIIALSIKIDLIDTNFLCLSEKIEKMLSASSNLHQSLQEVPLPREDNPGASRNLQNSHQLHKKISNLLSSARGIKNELKNIWDLKEIAKEIFPSSTDSSGFLNVLEEGEAVFRAFMTAEQSKLWIAKKMIEIYFRFLSVRHEILNSEGLQAVGGRFMGIEGQLLKLEKALESFQTILGQCQRDFQEFTGEIQQMKAIAGGGDTLVKDNIVLGHLINELLTNMEDIKVKLSSLDQ